MTGGLISFEGFYPRDPAGSDDAQFIRWKLNEFCTHPNLRLAGLVIDLERLDYERGDDLSIAPVTRTLPWLAVVCESHREAFSYVIDREKLRFDLREALAEMNEIMW